MIKVFRTILLLFLLVVTVPANAKNFTPTPEWITKLPAVENASQVFIVAGVDKTTAWVSMHEKNSDGTWQQIMTTPGFIGKNGLGKTKEGDGMTSSRHIPF